MATSLKESGSKDLKLSDNVKVYSGGAGVKVAVVLVLPPESGKALVEVSGTDGKVEKIVRLHEKENTSRNGYAWRTKHKGRDSYTLRFDKDSWSNAETVRCWWPGGDNEGLVLGYDEAASKLVKPDDLLNRHLRQASDGTLDELAAFKRDEYVAQSQKGFDEAKADAEKAIGTTFEASVDFSTVTDEALMKYSIGSYCGSPFASLRRFLDWGTDEEKAFYKTRIKERVKKVKASVGKKPSMTLNGGEITWVTAWDESNLDDMTYQVLRNELNKN